MKSPFTGKEMKMVCEKRTWKFRGEQYEYVHTAWLCEDSGELFTTDETDDVGYMQVTNQYRTRYGVPFTDEIIAVREKYGVSAAKMAMILGIGINQWRLYEGGEVPSVSNGRMIRSIVKPEIFLEYVHSSKHLLGDLEYKKLVERVMGLVGDSGKKGIERYAHSRVFASERGSDNGYGKQSLEHLKNVLLYIIERCGDVFQTKMNKLLFYADFVSYRKYGLSISGLSYKALDYGPVPERWDRIYSQFDEIIQVPRIVGEREGVALITSIPSDRTALTCQELAVLDEVCDRFMNSSSAEISRISHQEEAWLKCRESQGLISFDYAFLLKAL